MTSARHLTHRKDRGTSLLEVAFILPLLVLLVLGIIDIGRYATFSIGVSSAARAGVQYGAQSLATASDASGIQSAARNDDALNPPLQVSSTVSCYCSGAACSGPCVAPNVETLDLVVNTSGTFTPLFNYPGVPPATTVSGMAEMRVAQ
jgi:Flp pilus assembly protein TadG